MSQLLTKSEVLARVKLTFPTVWRLMREGRFPRPVDMADGGRALWFEHEIEDYLNKLPRKKYLGDPGLEGGHPGKVEMARAGSKVRHRPARRAS